MRSLASVAFAAILLSGCSSPGDDGDKPLVTSATDTVSVRTAAEMWESLTIEERAVFLEAENPAAEFVDALAGKMALEILADSSGLLQDTSLSLDAASWFRVECATLARRLTAEVEMAAVDESDIVFWRENEGIQVLFTAEVVCPAIPLPLGELPRELATALAGISQGDSVEVEGFGTVNLVSRIDPGQPHSSEPDSVIVELIGFGRERFGYLRDYAALLGDGETRIDRDFTSLDMLPGDSVVVSSPVGNWTRRELEQEVAFIRTRFAPVEASAYWMDMIAENLIMQSHYTNVLRENYPELADSLQTASESFRRGLAIERLVRDRMDSVVVVTRADLEDEYSRLPEPVMTAELRVFATASAHLEDLPDLRRSMMDGSDPGAFPPLSELAVPGGDPGITRPLMRAEIPGGIAEALFGIAPEDTVTWQGPFEVEPGYFAAFRLLEVIAPRPATIEEIGPRLEESARLRLEAAAMEEFLSEIRERFGVTVNSSVLNDLPADPGQWMREE